MKVGCLLGYCVVECGWPGVVIALEVIVDAVNVGTVMTLPKLMVPPLLLLLIS
jgi:hypothetical protein